MKVAIVLLVGLSAVVFAEPPVPSNQYIPSNQYSPPSNQYGAPSRPSPNYGAPSSTYTSAVIRPNNQYGAPSARPTNNYLPPTTGGYSGQGGYSGGQGGYGGGYDDQSEPANYNFKYDVQDAASGNDFGHEESRQGDVAQGKYYVLLPDGRRQVVEYTADSQGYKPKISYEQVGGGYQGGGYPSGGQGGYQSGGYRGGNAGYQY